MHLKLLSNPLRKDNCIRSAHAQPAKQTLNKIYLSIRILSRVRSVLARRIRSVQAQCALPGRNACIRFLTDVSFPSVGSVRAQCAPSFKGLNILFNIEELPPENYSELIFNKRILLVTKLD